MLRERDAAGFAADFVELFAAVRLFAGAFAAERDDVLRDAAGFAVRVLFLAADFAADVPAVFVAVRPEAARVDVLRLVDFVADFVADFAFARVVDFAADFAAVRPLAEAAFVADFAAERVLAAAFFAVDLAADAFFAVDDFADDDFAADFADDVFALAAVPRADDERADVLFDVLLFEAVLRDAGFFAEADELRELDDREDERVAAAIVRVTSARPWVTSPIVASPHVASAISPPWVINDPPESICANGDPAGVVSTACTGRFSVRRPRGQHGQLLLLRDESLRDCIAFTCPKTRSVMHVARARSASPVRGRRSACSSSDRRPRTGQPVERGRPDRRQSIGSF